MAENYSRTNWVNGTTIANSTTMGHIEDGLYEARLSYAGFVPLDDFAGADDDTKLANAMGYAGAQTFSPGILLNNRMYTFNNPIGQPYNGWALIGANQGNVSPQGNWATEVRLNIATGTPRTWIDLTGATAYNWLVQGIYFTSTNNNTQFARAPAGHVLWSSRFHNLGFKGFKGVLGNSGEAFATDLITTSGQWQCLTNYDTPFNIRGGDDTNLWGEGMNLGSGDNVGGGGGKYLMMFSSNSKFDMGPVYISADNGWRGILHQGSYSSGYAAYYNNVRIEGRNAGSACAGNLFRMTGGVAVLNGCSINDGMDAPLASEHGLVETLGTETTLVVNMCTFSHGNVPLSTPVVYAGGSSKVRVAHALRAERDGSSGAWGSTLPVVQESTAGNAQYTDNSVNKVTGP